MRSLGAKLIAGLLASLAGVLLWLGSANLRVLRENLETTVVLAEQRIADIIFRSTRSSMLHNDRDALIGIVDSIGAQQGVRKIRIISTSGTIYHSTVAGETGQKVDRTADACTACHAAARPAETTFRVYRMNNERVIGLTRPIVNEQACSNAACHAHPTSQHMLGVLDVVLSLDSVDQATAAHERRMRAQVGGSALLIMGIAGFLIWTLISRPIRHLIRGVHVLGTGNLGYRFGFRRKDEIGELAAAFDEMANQLDVANRTLEERIQRKTRELEAAQEKLIHSEKLSSLGQLSAAVAHEINNPLAGIFTYAKLLEKKLSPPKPALEWIQTIQHESRRCGEIVNNLLVFARKQHTEIAPAEVKTIINRTVAVIQHKLQMQQIALEVSVDDLPALDCDASQIQQVLMAIAMNAVDAMGNTRAGVLKIRAARIEENRVDISLTNNGPAIPKEVLPKIFEPFFSTKQAASGVGLGLAVAYGIVKRHGGEIQVDTGAETTFHVILPAGQMPALTSTESSNVRRQIIDSHS